GDNPLVSSSKGTMYENTAASPAKPTVVVNTAVQSVLPRSVDSSPLSDASGLPGTRGAKPQMPSNATNPTTTTIPYAARQPASFDIHCMVGTPTTRDAVRPN